MWIGDGRAVVEGQQAIGEAEPREFAAKWLFDERVATDGAHVISSRSGNAILRERCR